MKATTGTGPAGGRDAWWRIDFTGVVQGVGFRPTVYRVARTMGLSGWVMNATDGVHASVGCARGDIDRFVDAIASQLPPIARIESVAVMPIASPSPLPDGFTIVASRDSGSRPTDVSPDAAICADCLADIASHPRRLQYPLTNCTNCGPRFSIVAALPYDRPLTSMASFAMCPGCAAEYSDPADRRFHAQPVSCNDCGPRYSMATASGVKVDDIEAIISLTAGLIEAGAAVAVKSTGGYNLVCNARDARAVEALRELKCRPRKPFAVMTADAATARRFVRLDEAAAGTLTSWRAPIVVAPLADGGERLPEAVAPGNHSLGVMLPSMGFHHILLKRLGPGAAIVVTSANRRGCPILTDDDDARAYGRENGLAVVGYNRAIVNRVDDSVVRFVAGEPLILRRARGYVPEPIDISLPTDGIVALGADITSAWALGRGTDIIQSPYVGSLTSEEGCRALEESIASMSGLFRVEPRVAVVDAHPRYESRRIGLKLGAARVVEMWHHHAHAVSVMADRGLEGKVLALVLDGTGLAPDGMIHGAELMEADRLGFTTLRHGHFLPMPGGDAAAREPWRMAVSLAVTLFGSADVLPADFVEAVGKTRIQTVEGMIRRHINSPLSCGAGRLWDALAALLGLAHSNSYEAEAPLLLESAASRHHGEATPYPLSDDDPLDLTPMFREILAELRSPDADRRAIARRFHLTYARAWAIEIARASHATGLRRVVASGGVMQNALFASDLSGLLRAEGLELLLPRRTPVNDACIAVGQLAHAAALPANPVCANR